MFMDPNGLRLMPGEMVHASAICRPRYSTASTLFDSLQWDSLCYRDGRMQVLRYVCITAVLFSIHNQ